MPQTTKGWDLGSIAWDASDARMGERSNRVAQNGPKSLTAIWAGAFALRPPLRRRQARDPFLRLGESRWAWPAAVAPPPFGRTIWAPFLAILWRPPSPTLQSLEAESRPPTFRRRPNPPFSLAPLREPRAECSRSSPLGPSFPPTVRSLWRARLLGPTLGSCRFADPKEGRALGPSPIFHH